MVEEGEVPLDEERGTERKTLVWHLDWNRKVAVSKVSGLTWEQATQRLGPSATSAAGIIRHLTDVERWWFRRHLAGESDVPFRWSEIENDVEFQFDESDTLAAVIADYELACRESRAIIESHTLEDRCARPTGAVHPSLRWLLVHMIEETARHNGHLDIYVELLTGRTGEL
jgi:uncharacterized damage-inducible protein DinB